ncbi:unnamed protein product [Symbiodinium natans]|uniref:CHAT domain-containing protein n=1 Tax=Symbiodinium natans TaxID=878477 RepID=A0A812PAU6_9DINO|nr:unnamed protein product [Symbiodinium natans]
MAAQAVSPLPEMLPEDVVDHEVTSCERFVAVNRWRYTYPGALVECDEGAASIETIGRSAKRLRLWKESDPKFDMSDVADSIDVPIRSDGVVEKQRVRSYLCGCLRALPQDLALVYCLHSEEAEEAVRICIFSSQAFLLVDQLVEVDVGEIESCGQLCRRMWTPRSKWRSAFEQVAARLEGTLQSVREFDRLVFVVSGALADVPMHALPLCGKEPLFLSKIVTYANSLVEMSIQPKPSLKSPHKKATAIISNPTAARAPGDSDDMPDLPFADCEASTVAEQLSSPFVALSGASASLRQVAGLSRVMDQLVTTLNLHLCLHFHCDEQSSDNSAFLLAHGDALPVSRFAAAFPEFIDTVFLSGCNTGAFSTQACREGSIVVRSISGARAARVVCTGWPVGDACALLVAQKFYAELNAGTDAAKALQRAQAAIAPLRAKDVKDMATALASAEDMLRLRGSIHEQVRGLECLEATADAEPMGSSINLPPFWWACHRLYMNVLEEVESSLDEAVSPASAESDNGGLSHAGSASLQGAETSSEDAAAGSGDDEASRTGSAGSSVTFMRHGNLFNSDNDSDEEESNAYLDMPLPQVAQEVHRGCSWQPLVVEAVPNECGGGYVVLDKAEKALVFWDTCHEKVCSSKPSELAECDFSWVDLAIDCDERSSSSLCCLVLTYFEILSFSKHRNTLTLLWNLKTSSQFCSLALMPSSDALFYTEFKQKQHVVADACLHVVQKQTGHAIGKSFNAAQASFPWSAERFAVLRSKEFQDDLLLCCEVSEDRLTAMSLSTGERVRSLTLSGADINDVKVVDPDQEEFVVGGRLIIVCNVAMDVIQVVWPLAPLHRFSFIPSMNSIVASPGRAELSDDELAGLLGPSSFAPSSRDFGTCLLLWDYAKLKLGSGAIGFDGSSRGRPKPSTVTVPKAVVPPFGRFPYEKLLVVSSMTRSVLDWCVKTSTSRLDRADLLRAALPGGCGGLKDEAIAKHLEAGLGFPAALQSELSVEEIGGVAERVGFDCAMVAAVRQAEPELLCEGIRVFVRRGLSAAKEFIEAAQSREQAAESIDHSYGGA